MEGYPKTQIRDAKRVRDLMVAVGCPSLKGFKSLIKVNMLMYCKLTIEYVEMALDIFEHNVPSLKGKTMRKTPYTVKNEVVHIPHYILDRTKVIAMCNDICFTNTQPFIRTISQVKLCAIQHMVNTRKKTKLSGITTMCKIYGAK